MDKEIKPAEAEKMVQQTEVLVDIIKPSLAGLDPSIQGAVIAELFAIYLAGHSPVVRDDIRALWLDMVADLLELYDEQNSPKKNSKKN